MQGSTDELNVTASGRGGLSMNRFRLSEPGRVAHVPTPTETSASGARYVRRTDRAATVRPRGAETALLIRRASARAEGAWVILASRQA